MRDELWQRLLDRNVPPCDGLPPEEARALALYAPFAAEAFAVGHLGQSLDGFIATAAGRSHYVTGRQNIVHLHRLRALADAVLVGAGTVAHDDPRLTVRHVTGRNPVRVVLDPKGALSASHSVFADKAAPTLWLHKAGAVPAALAGVEAVAMDDPADPAAILDLLAARGLRRIFVEGGGRTVSAFLEAGCLDRLHVAVAPLIIGSGRPGIVLPPVDDLADALRPPCRIFPMGRDVLFDCDLKSRSAGEQVAVPDNEAGPAGFDP